MEWIRAEEERGEFKAAAKSRIQRVLKKTRAIAITSVSRMGRRRRIVPDELGARGEVA